MDEKDKMIREINKDYKELSQLYLDLAKDMRELQQKYEAVVIENIELQQTIEDLEDNMNYLGEYDMDYRF